jgi:hypothetical protein
MKSYFFLISIYEGDLNYIKAYTSLELAQKEMKADVIEALKGSDESIFNDYKEGEDFLCEPDSTEAWVNTSKEYAWCITYGSDIEVVME